MWDWLAPVAGAVLGATQSDKGGQVTESNSIDPRIANILYGSSGTGGLLGDAQSIYSQQMQQGGLNDMQRQGLNMQAQYLQSPQFQNSYQSMMNQGMGLMGRGVAGNPFTQGNGGSQASSMPSGGYQYTPSQTQAPVYRPAQQAPAQAPTNQAAPAQRETQGGGGGQSSGGGSQLGTGRMTDAINDDAMATFNQYLALGLTPAVAVALVQRQMATSQTLDAVNATDDPLGTLNAVQGWTDTETAPAYSGRSSSGNGYGNMGNGSYGGATGGYGGSYGSGSVGGFGRSGSDD